MKIFTWLVSLVILTLAIGLTSCNKDDETPDHPFRVALLVDDAGINDKTFNQSTYEGILAARQDIPFDFTWEVGHSPADYEGILKTFADEGADLVIAPGFNLTGAVTAAALQYPAVDFFLLDDRPGDLPANMVCGLFEIDEASFLCGFLAAWWAQYLDQDQPVAAWVGGPPVATIEQIKTGYVNGISYFNTGYPQNTSVAGGHTASFTDSTRAAFLADSLIGAGADVIFAFAGMAGNAALEQTKVHGKQGIGIDSDQYISFPEVKDILLTSCMKNLGSLTGQLLTDYANGIFPGGNVVMGTLSNGGVGMAPYHDYETQIPDSVKLKLNEIREGITGGTISTGWE